MTHGMLTLRAGVRTGGIAVRLSRMGRILRITAHLF